LGLVALSLGSELSDFTLVLIFVGYVASWFAEEKVLSRPSYAPAWTVAVVSFLAIQVLRGVAAQPTLAMAIEFAAFLQISRLSNRRTAVDYQQIAVLSFLHLIAATVLSTTLGYAAIFAGFVIATPWMLALSHLRREIEGNYPAQNDADPTARSAVRRVLASKRVVGPSFLVGTALLSLPLFAMTLAIFITIPRGGQGFLSFQRDSGQRVAGFGNQVELGGFGLIRDDPTVVVRVMPLPKVDERAPRLVLRLRGTSFDYYDGRVWSRSSSGAQPLPRSGPHLYAIRRLPRLREDRQFRVVLDHLDESVVFLPAGTVALSVPPRVSSGESIERALIHSPGLDVRYESSDGLGLVYTVYVTTDPAESGILPIANEHRAEYLQVPLGHERVAALARRVVGDAISDEDKALRVERFLKRGEYTYSLQQPNVGKRIPLDVFLFEQKRGHCEYYSTAMAIMLRTQGVPTRNVTGFAGGQYNPYGGYYALRQGDAHSWVEVYLHGQGWVTFDPTPSARADAGPREGLWNDLNALIDAVRTRWMTSVVGYDLRAQVGMLRKLAALIESLRGPGHRGLSDRAGGVHGFGPHIGWRTVARWLGLAALLALLAYALFKLLRPRSGQGGRQLSQQQARVVALYAELERALRRRGHPRPPSLTPLEHARELRAQGFAEHAEVDAVTRSYLEARYGGRPLRNAEIVDLKRKIARVRRAA
ncbi:MAG: DUF3488 and DUF4129 domain-containing transglutaminase family protein, partial [Polyangiales bacterium]